MSSRVLDFEKYTAKARQAVAEGQVLLINETGLDQNTLIHMGRKPPYIT